MRALTVIFYLVLAAGAEVWSQQPRVPAQMQFADINLKIKDDARREIQEDVDKLTRNPKFFNIHLQRARTYFPIIERIFEEEGVPDDLKFLVIQESALISDAVSSSDAVGFWQFKDFTAKEMGLRVDKFVDERKNIVSSSRAAARYIKKNNTRFFDNWLVALQAYQMGPGGALKAGGEKYKGHKSMTIDRRTYWYIKKYLAHKVAFENALKGPIDISVAEYWKGANKSMSDISRETGVAETELQNYNKWLQRGKIPTDKSYAVIVPVGTAQGKNIDFGSSPSLASTTMRSVNKPYAAEYTFTNSEEYPYYGDYTDAKAGQITEINGRKAVIAKKGDRAVSLATRGDISLKKFYKYNDMDASDRVSEGQVYYLQRKKSKQAAYHHVVEHGETFWTISQKYGIRENKLLMRNRLRKEEPLKEGRILWLHAIRPRDIPVEYFRQEPKDVPVIVKKEEEPENRVVAIPENFFASADDESVQVVSVEDEDRDSYDDADVEVEEADDKTKAQRTQKVHVVHAGETLYSISREYGVRIDDLLDWNGISITDPLAIDQELVLYEGNNPGAALADDSVVEEDKKAENSEIYYTVQSGDTFYSISRKFGVTVGELKEMNGKADDLLKPGERLRVK